MITMQAEGSDLIKLLLLPDYPIRYKAFDIANSYSIPSCLINHSQV